MMDEQKRKKRVVSKGEFVRHMGKMLSLFCMSVALIATGVFGLWVCVMIVDFIRSPIDGPLIDDGPEEYPVPLFVWGLMILSGVIGLLMLWLGGKLGKRAYHAERVVPIMRSTAAQLPDEESLVRASAEPEGKAEEELLRAASATAETPAEELLRAHTGETE